MAARERTGPRMTIPTQLVLRALLAEPAQELYGLQICETAGLPSGTIHPILARLEGQGWLESRWEDIKPKAVGRPRRRYYRLTEDGAERARIALAQATTSVSTIGLRPRPAAAGSAYAGAGGVA
jgi:PadR family transcriptional regulator, regulatory protein PadR